jgi:acetyltransferase
MQKLIAYQRAQGTQRLVATILNHNERMLKLAKRLHFEIDHPSANDAGMRVIGLVFNKA